MTPDTFGLSEEEYLIVFQKKAEFVCKTLKVLSHVVNTYNIELEPKLFWDLFQEIGYITDDACRIRQKEVDPEALDASNYTPIIYPTTAAVFTEVQKLEKLINVFIEQNKNGFLSEERISNFPSELKK